MTTRIWYDASDTSTITSSGGFVSQWDDKSGNDQHLTQVNASNRPQTGTRQVNSLNVVDFSDDYMDSSSLSMPSECDILFCATVDTVDNGSDALLAWRAGWQKDWQFDAANNSEFRGRWLPQTGQGFGTPTPWGQGNLIGSPRLFGLSFDYDSSLMTGYFDGAAVTTLTDNYLLTVGTPGSFRLFGNRGGFAFPQGVFAELVFVDKQTTANRQKIEGYLAHKWGLEGNLPSDHPFKASAP